MAREIPKQRDAESISRFDILRQRHVEDHVFAVLEIIIKMSRRSHY